MSDIWTEAVEEAYASSPAGVAAWDTLELRHPMLDAPQRFVLDHGEKIGETEPDSYGNTQDIYGRLLRLEEDAPENAGEIVAFLATAFEVRRPRSEAGKPPEMAIVLDNVPATLMAALGPAAASGAAVSLTYREYLSDDPDTVHFTLRDLELRRVGVTALRIEGKIGFMGLFSKVFPGAFYNAKDNKTLARA